MGSLECTACEASEEATDIFGKMFVIQGDAICRTCLTTKTPVEILRDQRVMSVVRAIRQEGARQAEEGDE